MVQWLWRRHLLPAVSNSFTSFRLVYICFHFFKFHSLFNPPSAPIIPLVKCIHQTPMTSVLQNRNNTVQLQLYCPLCSIWHDGHSFFLPCSLPLDPFWSPGSLSAFLAAPLDPSSSAGLITVSVQSQSFLAYHSTLSSSEVSFVSMAFNVIHVVIAS